METEKQVALQRLQDFDDQLEEWDEADKEIVKTCEKLQSRNDQL